MKSLVNLNSPVEVVSYEINISENETDVSLKTEFINYTKKTISAMKIKLLCFNSFDEPVGNKIDNVVDKTLQDLNAKASSKFMPGRVIILQGYGETRNIDTIIM